MAKFEFKVTVHYYRVWACDPIKGFFFYNTPLTLKKSICFVCYRKIIHTFIEKKYTHLKEFKNGIGILGGQVVLKLWIETVKISFRPITKLVYLNLNAIFKFLWQLTVRCIYHLSKKLSIVNWMRHFVRRTSRKKCIQQNIWHPTSFTKINIVYFYSYFQIGDISK